MTGIYFKNMQWEGRVGDLGEKTIGHELILESGWWVLGDSL